MIANARRYAGIGFCQRNFGYLTVMLMALGLFIIAQQTPQQMLYQALLSNAARTLPGLPRPIIRSIRPQDADRHHGVYAIIELKYSARPDAPKIDYVIFNDPHSASTYLHHYVNLIRTAQSNAEPPLTIANGSCAALSQAGSCGARSANVAVFSFANRVESAAAMINGALSNLHALRERLGAAPGQAPLQSSPLPRPRTGGLV